MHWNDLDGVIFLRKVFARRLGNIDSVQPVGWLSDNPPPKWGRSKIDARGLIVVE